MLAVQRYRPQKYPPGPHFAQFGDTLFAGHVKAAGQASNRMASSNRKHEFAAIHMERLERAGLKPYNAETYSIHTPDGEGFESAANSLRPSRTPSEYRDPLSAPSMTSEDRDAGSMMMMPSRDPSERGQDSPPRPQVTE